MDEEAELVILNISGDAPLGREFQAAKAVLAERGKVLRRRSGGRCSSGSRRGELVDLRPRAPQ